MNNLNRPLWLSGAGVALALASVPAVHILHWYVVSICLSVASVACAVCGCLWARRNYRAVRREIDERGRRHRG